MIKQDQLKTHSYVPYSAKPRVCLIEGESGKCYPGVRIENISFPLTIPAVQAAIVICLSEGDRPATLYTDQEESPELSYWITEFELIRKPYKQAPADELAEVVLPDTIDPVKQLHNLFEHSVTGNSNFPVSALLATDAGFISGVNIETRSWANGLCAERVALAKAISYGYDSARALYIHTKFGEYSSPCGACRQVIFEHLPHHPVYLHHADHSVSRHFSSDLLPYSFKTNALTSKS